MSSGTIKSGYDMDVWNGRFQQTGGSTTLTRRFNVGNFNGQSGSATIIGGSLSAGSLIVGDAGGSGTLSISGTASVSITNSTTVTCAGKFFMSGGSLTTHDLDLGSAGSFSFTGGTITVNGGAMTPKRVTLLVFGTPSGTFFTNSFDVNGASTSTLTLHAGGTLASTAPNFFLGHSGKSGFLSIDGPTSALILNVGQVYVGTGRDATGTTSGIGKLSLTNGGHATTTKIVHIGSSGGNGYVSADGVNSALASLSEELQIGESGFMNGSTYYASERTVSLTSGGQATGNGIVHVGSSGGKGLVSVDGANSKLSTGWMLIVGESGYFPFSTVYASEGTLSLTNGGRASSFWDTRIGDQVGMGYVSVVGGILDVGQQLNVGYFSALVSTITYRGLGTLAVSSGGSVTSNSSVIGSYGGVGTVSFNGIGTGWANTTNLYIGNDSSGANGGQGTVSVSSGATLTNGQTLKVYSTGRLSLASGAMITTGTLDMAASPSNFAWTGGTLKINTFAPAADGLLTVPNTGTLGGTGNIQRPVTVSLGGTLAPGNSVGTITTGNLDLQTGSSYLIELDITANTADKTVVNGSVNLNGVSNGLGGTTGGAGLQFVFLSGTPPLGVPRVFTIIDKDGSDAVTGLFANVLENVTYALGQARYSVNYHGGSGNDVVLTITEVPEPAAMLLYTTAATSLLRRRRGTRSRAGRSPARSTHDARNCHLLITGE